MRHWTGRSAGALTALLLGTTAVQADVTAAEVWQGLTDYYGDLGQTVTTGSSAMDGDTLVVTDAVFASETPEGGTKATVAEIRLKELGDGRVEVTMSEEIPVAITAKPATGEAVDMAMKITQSGLAMVVSGQATDMTFDFTADTIGIRTEQTEVEGDTVPMTLDATLTGNAGNYRIVTEGARNVTSTMTADKLDFAVSGKDPKAETDFSASGSLAGLSGTSTATMPDAVDFADMGAALQAGLAMEGTFDYTSGGYVIDGKDGADTVSIQSTGGAGALKFAMSRDGLSYGGTGKAAQIAIQASALPIPVDLSVAETAFDMKMPVSKSEESQPFGLLVKLIDFEVSEGIWAMFDPTTQLPRDPATLIVDLSGAAKVLFDIFDLHEPAAPDASPGEIESLDINEVKLSAVGAELTGSGAMTFDNSAPVPQPRGMVDLQLVGGNGLIDKLVAMGFVPEDQAAGAKMMMGLFAVPSGEDTLTSKIEFKEDGGVYANGQRIQ
ncbi:DUF2125 domain-containing protein [Defluviimonas sp. WL0024]|uniref:DUF2125 domain-containing protein n=1 Tax=Albidovulum salinarum TaxID=2984153 RepID=A0ABT2X256_9RHOB|nr:DUF2125 domain-containing protein [Defluviimonas sp. WL0024]MCU9848024.1 DUF2125 domain-containing protein [Defluviimonas sp. WL0024]